MDKVRANVYIDREVRDRAKFLAEWMGLSFSEFVNGVLREYLNKSFELEVLERAVEELERVLT
mgnify:CR=1 FL=1